MTLRQDISKVIEYLGKKGNFQFQTKLQGGDASPSDAFKNADKEFFDNLQRARIFLAVPDRTDDGRSCSAPSDADRDDAAKLLAAVDDLKHRVTASIEEAKRVDDAYKEALAFSNLKASYSELEHLSFLSLRIGKIDPTLFEALKDAVGERAVVIPLGNDNSRILAASSKKGRFALDTELKKFNFVNMEIPQDFKGIPDDVLAGLKNEKIVAAQKVAEMEKERSNFAETHREKLLALLGAFSIGMQIQDVESKLQSTELVYRLTGWVSSRDSKAMMKELDELTEGRIAIREYLPSEVPSVINGKEQVPVEVHHRKFVKGFERMLFSYGAPVYGTIDPTPFVALFFTLLFGIMFGDFRTGPCYIFARSFARKADRAHRFVQQIRARLYRSRSEQYDHGTFDGRVFYERNAARTLCILGDGIFRKAARADHKAHAVGNRHVGDVCDVRRCDRRRLSHQYDRLNNQYHE